MKFFYVLAAAALAQLGRIDEAKDGLARAQQDKALWGAGLNQAFTRVRQFKHAEDGEHYVEALRKAGLVEDDG
jgi:hypothetical protein